LIDQALAVNQRQKKPAVFEQGAAEKRRLRVTIVQQGVWDTPLESMPLAAGYLRAMAEADLRVRDKVEIRILNFRGGDTLPRMAYSILDGETPDILAFSVLGWNFDSFGALAETYRRCNPDGWVVFGGTHVTNQAERVFRRYPSVDVVANGEGEFTFIDLILARLGGADIADLNEIAGISIRRHGETITTPNRDRIADLSTIPSPVLSGAIPLTKPDGSFLYDVALMESNRGCPYQCSFCYWGGATGQKVRTFPMDQLLEEAECFARLGVETLILCDANFGMLPRDKEFVEGVIEIRERWGFPHSIESSWAKNKSDVFYAIVRRMKQAGLKTSFTLALQSLDEGTLGLMHRRNMRVNDWEGLVDWLEANGFDCYAELIWGSPGETAESFLRGYDQLSERVSRIATYPLLILPNTRFFDERDSVGLVTVRGDADDFEYVLAHDTMAIADNRQMMRFLFWARSIAENMYFRHIWAPLRKLARWKQSEVIWSVADWFDACEEPGAEQLHAAQVPLVDSDVVGRTIKHLHSDPRVPDLFRAWWEESVAPQLPEEHREALTAIFEYDLLTRPIYDPPGMSLPGDLSRTTIDGEAHYVRATTLTVDVPSMLTASDAGDEPASYGPVEVQLGYKVGFYRHCDSTEAAAHFYGRPVSTAARAELVAG
jgi:radical SAM superfamily enzyme YgiQ (UPF0313 family)